MKKALKDSWWIWAVRLLPFLIAAEVCGRRLRHVGGGDILQYTPDKRLVSRAGTYWLLCSQVAVCGVPAAGALPVRRDTLPLPAALLVNTAGLLVCITVPYLLGRLAGHSFIDRMTARYVRIQAINAHKGGSRPVFLFFFCG